MPPSPQDQPQDGAPGGPGTPAARPRSEPIGVAALGYAVLVLVLPVSHGLLSVPLLAHNAVAVIAGVVLLNAIYVLLAFLSRRRRRKDPERWRGAYDIFAGSVLMLIFDALYAWLVIRMVSR